jgi:NhaP-type Na+/H+ or K+/H+ antiporter
MEHQAELTTLAVFAGCVLVWGLVSVRLERWNISAPIAFVALGVVLTHGPVAPARINIHSSTLRTLAELTLALVLFADASRVNARTLRHGASLPVRLLGIGLPLTIAAGAGVGAALFGGTGLWVAALLGAIVAPTDAALGAAIMSDDRVPDGVRRLLNIESGLNDGIATPFVNLFLAGALTSEALRNPGVARAAVDLLGGAGMGAAIGAVGAFLLVRAARHQWSEPSFRPLAVLGVALAAYVAALLVHTNGFVAAFVAGMAFGTVTGSEDTQLGYVEESGTLLSLLVWFAFGAVILVPGLRAATWRDVVFAVGALTVVRMVPVAVALAGSGVDRATVAFVGWFGPRGLASVVFGLIAVDSLDPAAASVVLGAVTVTVTASVVLHGVTASPLAARYAARVGATTPMGPATADARPLATRDLRGRREPTGDPAP